MPYKNKSPARVSWSAMRDRCSREKHHAYERYGGRGIKVCARWAVFENFLADMGERPDGKSLDRIDNDGDYEPENCRWATMREQLNNKSSNRIVELDGKQMTLSEAARALGMNVVTAVSRIHRGLSLEAPYKPRKRRQKPAESVGGSSPH